MAKSPYQHRHNGMGERGRTATGAVALLGSPDSALWQPSGKKASLPSRWLSARHRLWHESVGGTPQHTFTYDPFSSSTILRLAGPLSTPCPSCDGPYETELEHFCCASFPNYHDQ